MTIALVIALAVTISADNDLEIPVKCPAVDLPEDVRLKHETDDTKFYLCQQGQKILMDCPYRNKFGDRSHFNPQLQTCEWSDMRLLESYPNKKICPHPKKCERNPDPTDKNCRRFYQCDHGKQHKMQCRKGLRFNPKTQMCDFEDNVDCNEGDCPEGTKHPHDCSCHKYYECKNQEKVLKECKNGRFFDPKKEKCVKPDTVPGCIIKPSDLVSLDEQCPINNVTSIVTYSHESSCTLYHECNQGKILLRKCPATMHFNSIQGICEPATTQCDKYCNKDNGDKGFPVPDGEDDDDEVYFTQFECPTNNHNIKLPHETSCSLYYTCQNGRRVIQKCREGMHFNIETNRCELKKNAGCMHPESTDVTEEIESTIPVPNVICIGECPSTNSVNHMVNLPTNDCSKFCTCSNGVPVVQSCPTGLHYDTKNQSCNWPNKAKCAKGFAKNNVMEYLVKTN